VRENDLTFDCRQGTDESAGVLTLYVADPNIPIGETVCYRTSDDTNRTVDTQPSDLVVDVQRLDGGAGNNHANAGPGQTEHHRNLKTKKTRWTM
jgi:hypothetical protein